MIHRLIVFVPGSARQREMTRFNLIFILAFLIQNGYLVSGKAARRYLQDCTDTCTYYQRESIVLPCRENAELAQLDIRVRTTGMRQGKVTFTPERCAKPGSSTVLCSNNVRVQVSYSYLVRIAYRWTVTISIDDKDCGKRD